MEPNEKQGNEAFRIEVKKRDQNENFAFVDLELFHLDCFGGKILRQSRSQNSWTLRCERCNCQYEISHASVADVIKTAIDGQKRTAGNKNYPIIVTQREPG